MEEQTEQAPTERDAIAEWTAELAQLLDADPVDTAAAIALHRQIADAYAETDKFGKAAEHLEQIIQLLGEQTDTDLQRADIHHELALQYSRALDIERAITNGERAADLFAEHEAEHEYAKTYRRLGALYVENGENETGIQCLETAIEWGNKTQNASDTGNAHRTLAEIYTYLNKHNDSIKHYLQAVSCYQPIAEYRPMAACYQALARIYLQYGKHTLAIEHYERAKNSLLEMENPYEDLGVNELLIAKIYELKSQTDQAITRYQYAADFFGNVPNFFEQANAYVQIAVLYEGTKQWRAALDAYQAALPIAQHAADELQTSTIEEGIKHCQQRQSHSTNTPDTPNNPAPKTGVWGAFKKILGG